MLYKAVIGSEPPSHPEVQPFRHGFDLQCRSGFKFTEVRSGKYIHSVTWLFSRFSSHSLVAPNRSWQKPTHPTSSLMKLLLITLWLLKQIGTIWKIFNMPWVTYHCPSLPWCHWLILCWRGWILHEVFLLGDDRYIWARAWCSTHTGEFTKSSHPLLLKFFQVQFVNHEDISYVLASIAQVMASEGKISYGTCFQITMLPITYVLKLARAHYPDPSGEPGSFVEAVYHWLLCEILNAIGSHTIVQKYICIETIFSSYLPLSSLTCSLGFTYHIHHF